MAYASSFDSISYDVPGTYFEDGIRFFNWTTPEILQRIKQLKLYDGDIFLCGYPKSGNVWMKTIMEAVINQGDLDTFTNTTSFNLNNILENSFATASSAASRLFWSHLYYELLPDDFKNKKIKLVYILRDPKDVAVSYYHFHRGSSHFGPWKGSWNTFVNAFLNGDTLHGYWFDHVKSFLNHRAESDILFVKYEDLKIDTRQWIARVAVFLEKPLDDATLEQICEIVKFDNMKSSEHLNQSNWAAEVGGYRFMRKGGIGDYKTMFTSEQINAVNKRLKALGHETDFDLYHNPEVRYSNCAK